MTRAFLVSVLSGLVLAAAPAPGAEPPPVPVGVAVVDVTPSYPIRLNGYGSRKAESEGVETRLKAKALAIGGDAGSGPAVLLCVDNCGVPGHITEAVADRLKGAGVARERLAVSSSHTHCAPCLGGNLPFIFGRPFTPEEQAHVDRYTQELTDAMVKAARDALDARKPGKLAWARGSVGFAANRRLLKEGKWVGFGKNPAGPVDHSLPVLRVTAPDGSLRAVVAGYACHCTTLGGDFNKVCAEWAGYACDAIEGNRPGVVAMVVVGCGADADPQPRRGLEDAKAHGLSVAKEVSRLLKGELTPLSGTVAASFRRINLPFGAVPNRAQFAALTKRPGPEGYFARVQVERLDRGEKLPRTLSYPVQVWTFGDALAVVFLGGEVVVDYALRLNRECDADRLWVVAYANDVPCYIASKRVLEEGGYEADASMIYYGRPTRLAPEAEDRIVETVHELLPDTFDPPKGAARREPGRAAAEAGGPGLVVRGEVREPLRLTPAELEKLPRKTARAKDHGGREASFEGVALGAILERAGVPLGEKLRGENRRLYAVVEASDGYRAVFALPELDPAFTDRTVLLADRRDGNPMKAPEGPLRVVVPDEKRHARWVRQVIGVTVGRAPAGAEPPAPAR